MDDEYVNERLRDLKETYLKGGLDGLSVSGALKERVWANVGSGIPRRPGRRWAVAVGGVVVTALVVFWAHPALRDGLPRTGGHGRVASNTISSGSGSSAPDQIIPTMTGVAPSISDGHLHLTNVQYSLLPGEAHPRPIFPYPTEALSARPTGRVPATAWTSSWGRRLSTS